MGAAEQLAVPLTEVLTYAELQARFPYQYVAILMEEEDISGTIPVIRGRVLSNGRSPMDVVKATMPWRGPETIVGFYYTGVGMPDEDRDAVPAQI
jgi:hypothetical protein